MMERSPLLFFAAKAHPVNELCVCARPKPGEIDGPDL
jgi:hypothetical protein